MTITHRAGTSVVISTSVIITPAANVLQYAALIAAIATAVAAVTARLNFRLHQQQQEHAQENSFESYLIDAVAVVATACCGFLLRACCLGPLIKIGDQLRATGLLSACGYYLHHEITTNNAEAASRTITPKLKPANCLISSLDTSDERAELRLSSSEQQSLVNKQKFRRCCDDSEIIIDGYADKGDDDSGSIILTSKTTAVRAWNRDQKAHRPCCGKDDAIMRHR